LTRMRCIAESDVPAGSVQKGTDSVALRPDQKMAGHGGTLAHKQTQFYGAGLPGHGGTLAHKQTQFYGAGLPELKHATKAARVPPAWA